MIAIICGGRDYEPTAFDHRILDRLMIDTVFHGGARGADQFAADWANTRGIHVEAFPADWKAHGRAAGPMRNERMLHQAIARAGDTVEIVVIAFPGGRGTADMVGKARAAGVPVLSVG